MNKIVLTEEAVEPLNEIAAAAFRANEVLFVVVGLGLFVIAILIILVAVRLMSRVLRYVGKYRETQRKCMLKSRNWDKLRVYLPEGVIDEIPVNELDSSPTFRELLFHMEDELLEDGDFSTPDVDRMLHKIEREIKWRKIRGIYRPNRVSFCRHNFYLGELDYTFYHYAPNYVYSDNISPEGNLIYLKNFFLSLRDKSVEVKAIAPPSTSQGEPKPEANQQFTFGEELDEHADFFLAMYERYKVDEQAPQEILEKVRIKISQMGFTPHEVEEALELFEMQVKEKTEQHIYKNFQEFELMKEDSNHES